MPAETVIAVVAIVGMFAFFAGALALADVTTNRAPAPKRR